VVVVEINIVPVVETPALIIVEIASTVICEAKAEAMMPTITETIVVEMDRIPLAANATDMEMLSVIGATFMSPPKITIFKDNLFILVMLICIKTSIYYKHRTIY